MLQPNEKHLYPSTIIIQLLFFSWQIAFKRKTHQLIDAYQRIPTEGKVAEDMTVTLNI